MRTKYYIFQLSPLLLQPSFTRSEAAKLGVSGGTLAYYVNKGLLERVGPGIFFDPTIEIDVEHKWRDLFRVLYSVKDGVVCLITALDYYGLTEEISRDFWIAIPQKKKVPIIPQSRFVRFRNMDLGRTAIKLGNFEVSIFDKERTIIDAFRYLDKETAIKALKKLAKQGIDYSKISKYSQKLRVDIQPYILSVTT